MVKRLRDIIRDPSIAKINLKGKSFKKLRPIEKIKNILMKRQSPITEVKDLSGGEKSKYIYVKGKNFTPPRKLGNLLKIGGIGFLIIFVINAINVYVIGKSIENKISTDAYSGYNYLVDAGKSATKIQFEQALEEFEKAEANFEEAEDTLWFLKTDKTIYTEDDNLGQGVASLLESGKNFSIAGKYFLEAIEEFNKLPLYFVSKNDPESALKVSITDTISAGLEKTDLAVSEINVAWEAIKNVDADGFPPELKARILFAQEKVNTVATTLNSISEHFPALLKLLGDRYPHRFMILLQNNNEIRPTGGFIGSYMIVDINDGYIELMETHDVYDIDGSYHKLIQPPEEYYSFTSNWRLRDSNYSSDFPTSAKKARWFLEKEGGPTVDTVIAVNQGLLKSLLEITGPVQVGNFGALDSENYNLLLSFVIEGKVWGAEDPKHILKVFVKAFKEAIMKEELISKVTHTLYRAVQQKHIMAYSSDIDIQKLFESMGVAGTTHELQEKEDYLSVINFATGGTKSEQFMEEKIHHFTTIEKNGVITNEIKLTRSHLWSDEIYRQWKATLAEYGFDYMPDNIIDILGRGENKVLTKIYVPAASALIDSTGADVMTKYDKDLKKTYFLVEMNTKLGETSDIWIKYRLPFTFNFSPADTYKLIIEKQPGSKGSIFTKTVSTDEDLRNMSLFPAEARLNSEGVVSYATNLVYDRYFAGIWAK